MKLMDLVLIKKQPTFWECYFKETDNSETMLELNPTAGRIIELLISGESQNKIIEILMEEYNDVQDSVQPKVDAFITEIIQLGILDTPLPMKKRNTSIRSIGDGAFFLPSLATIELTNYCNLRCKHCYIESYEKEYFDRKKLTEKLIELKQLGVKYIQFTGGEPFLYPKFEEIVLFAKGLGFFIYITTNFSLPEFVTIFDMFKEKLSLDDVIQVSLDGLEEHHDSIRGKGRYSKTLENIRKIGSSHCKIIIASCVTAEWLNELGTFINVIIKEKIKFLRLSTVLPTGHGRDGSLSFNVEEISIVYDLFSRCKEQYRNQITINIGDDFVNPLTGYSGLVKNCGMGTKGLVLNANNTIRPCALLPKDSGFACNVDTVRGFLEAKSNFYADISFPYIPVCHDCPEGLRCKTCFAWAWVSCLKNREEAKALMP